MFNKNSGQSIMANLKHEALARRDDLTDEALIERVVARKDPAAFEVLVRRHGPMVMGVCRRALRNLHDAEDAFQATFLILFRKAHSIRKTSRLASWLYGVAHRTALKANTARRIMRNREALSDPMPEAPVAASGGQLQDLEQLLDEEIARLPQIYRLPIVLCDLEGMSGKEAARQLGWPEGTVSGRLTRGRNLLRNRLGHCGLVAPMGGLIAVLTRHASAASVPTPLLTSTIQGATLLASGKAAVGEVFSAKVAALTKGVLKSMLLSKLTGSVVALGLAAAGATAVNHLSKPSAMPTQVAVAKLAQVNGGVVVDQEDGTPERAAKIAAENFAPPSSAHVISPDELEKRVSEVMSRSASEDPQASMSREQAMKLIKAEDEANQTAAPRQFGGFVSDEERQAHIAAEKEWIAKQAAEKASDYQ
jgi:RNA polymerase sigma-70 factor (ECF subfamily)